MKSPLEVVKAALQAYVDKDRDRIEALIADEYSFTSPLDNHLSRETYFARCWPNSKMMTDMRFIAGAEGGESAWIIYEASTAQKRFRNSEWHRVKNGRITETEVYFGWDLPHKAPTGGHLKGDAGPA